MGRRNYLIEGGSATGKTSVCHELRNRGYQAINGDRELAYQGDPRTGEPMPGISGLAAHAHHLWRVEQVKSTVADDREPVTFFWGGSRNTAEFLHLFDDVFVLRVDLETLRGRLDARPGDEWGGRGRHTERDFIERLHLSGAEIPSRGVSIDATAPLHAVVDDILRRVSLQRDA